jgi:hypothetical protein
VKPAATQQPTGDLKRSFTISLAYALQRGLQMTFQVDEQEIAVELTG